MPAQLLRNLGAVHIGHADVQQNQIRLVFQCGGDPARPVERLADVMSGRLDHHREHLHEIDVVIDDEHLQACRLPIGRGRRLLLRRRSCRDSERQTDRELRPLAFAVAVRVDRASMHLHQLFCQRQADSESTLAAVSSTRLSEHLEDSRQRLAVESDAVVDHAYGDASIVGGRL